MAHEEEEEAACPVCGKNVGLDVPSCPFCGAEFEEEEVPAAAQPAVAADTSAEEEVACPVCGAVVGLDIASCPKCGAEFEEEEIEEVIEVEEKEVFEVEKPKPAPARAKPAPARPKPAPARARPRGRPAAAMDLPSGLTNLKVIGLSLAILGIIGLQVALMIDWYWGWVPPIEDNLGLFVALPIVVLIVGLLAFMLVKKALSSGRKMPSMMPSTTLALFMFGIFAMIMVLLWDPINSALQDSQGAVAGGFALVLVVGIVLIIMGRRMPQRSAF